jgi:hypothetical protein
MGRTREAIVGGGARPDAGLPMVVQSGKITAERLARDLRAADRPRGRPSAARTR